MSRTFSLRRLLIGVTIFCLVCRLAVVFPELFVALAYFAVLFVPTSLIWLTFLLFSNRPRLLSVNVLCGAAFTLFTFPPIYLWPLPSWWIEFMAMALPPAIGAIAFGGIELYDDISKRCQ